jgi:hypothetical protein
MGITFSVDKERVSRAREVLRVRGRTLNQEIRDHIQDLAGDDEIEKNAEHPIESTGPGSSRD